MKPDAGEIVPDALWSLYACLPTTRSRLAFSLGLAQNALGVPKGRPYGSSMVPGFAEGDPMQVRVYRVRAGAGLARRFVAASAELSAAGIRVPQVRWRRRFRSAAGWRIALGVTGLRGEPFHPEIEQDAEAIGNELRRWHGRTVNQRRLRSHEPVARMLMWQKARVELGYAEGPLRWPDEAKAATAIVSPLDAVDFVGAVGLSPGILENSRPARLAGGEFGWSDLDAVSCRPLRFDLVEAELHLLGARPALVERFEASYFRDDGRAAADWGRRRLQWYRLCLVAGMLREPGPGAAGEPSDPAPGSDGPRRATLCAAAFAVEDRPASAGQLVSEISAIAERWRPPGEAGLQPRPSRTFAG